MLSRCLETDDMDETPTTALIDALNRWNAYNSVGRCLEFERRRLLELERRRLLDFT